MISTIETLRAFIKAAENSRKYPRNTASALQVALNLFEKELNDEESKSIDVFKDHLSQIYQQVLNKNLSNYTAGSLDAYRKRVIRLLNDYYKYGIDPAKMASWNPTTRMRIVSKTKPEKVTETTIGNQQIKANELSLPESTTRFELALRPGVKAIIATPCDLSIHEAEKIKAYIEFLIKTLNQQN